MTNPLYIVRVRVLSEFLSHRQTVKTPKSCTYTKLCNELDRSEVKSESVHLKSDSRLQLEISLLQLHESEGDSKLDGERS
jgi:hypothetical protein